MLINHFQLHSLLLFMFLFVLIIDISCICRETKESDTSQKLSRKKKVSFPIYKAKSQRQPPINNPVSVQ